jgi:hypothetical protein
MITTNAKTTEYEGGGGSSLKPTSHVSINLQAVIRGKKQNKAPHTNKDSSPLSIFMLYFASVIDLLVTETNRYFHQHLDRQDETSTPIPDITNCKMFLFLAIIIQWVTTYATDSGTTGQGQNNSSQLSTPVRHKTVSCTFYITCTSQTMTNKLTIKTKTMTDCAKLGKFLICSMLRTPNFTTLLNIWQLMR